MDEQHGHPVHDRGPALTAGLGCTWCDYLSAPGCASGVTRSSTRGIGFLDAHTAVYWSPFEDLTCKAAIGGIGANLASFRFLVAL